MKDEKQDVKQEVKVASNEQATLALANMVAQGVKMADAKKRLGIK